MDYIIGVDIGTTNSKALAYSVNGQVLAQFSSSYRPIVPQEGFHELDPEVLTSAVVNVIRNTTNACSAHHLIGISFSSAMHGLIAVDEKGKALTNMITWADLRSSSYARKILADTNHRKVYEQTGTPVHAMSPLCKLMWLRDNQPEVFATAARFISIKEFIFFRFFDRYVVDRSIASSTGLFDIHALKWNKKALELAGISSDRLSVHVAADSIITGLNKESALLLNVRVDTPFIIGGSDGCMAHIGSNALKPRDVSITIGTSGAVRIMNDHPVNDTRGRIFNYLITDHLYLSGGPVNNGGNVLQWFAGNFLKKELQSPDAIETFIDEAMHVPPGSEGLVFLPYLYGERAPVWDADARGIFFGVSSVHTMSHFMRAAMEGISFSLFSILRSVEEVNGPVNNIYASGGFIRSRKWVSLLSDVLGKPLHVTHAEDSSAAGAAILGLQTLGVIKSWENATAFFDETELFEPNMVDHEVYLRNYHVYSNLYHKFKDLNS